MRQVHPRRAFTKKCLLRTGSSSIRKMMRMFAKPLKEVLTRVHRDMDTIFTMVRVE